MRGLVLIAIAAFVALVGFGSMPILAQFGIFVPLIACPILFYICAAIAFIGLFVIPLD